MRTLKWIVENKPALSALSAEELNGMAEEAGHSLKLTILLIRLGIYVSASLICFSLFNLWHHGGSEGVAIFAFGTAGGGSALACNSIESWLIIRKVERSFTDNAEGTV